VRSIIVAPSTPTETFVEPSCHGPTSSGGDKLLPGKERTLGDRSSPSRTPGKTRVMLVDDHSLVRDGLAELISGQEDLEVCAQASDASTALRLIREHRPDLVIVDLMLRDGSGSELIKQIVELDSSIKTLVCSMHDEALYAERVLAAGAMGYVSKQEPSRLVLEAIRRVLSGRIYTSEEVTERVLRRASGKSGREGESLIDVLSDRELEVFGLLGQGLGTRKIAERLKLSTKTIDTHRENIKNKLGLRNSHELLRLAVAWTLDPGSVARGKGPNPAS
jgi:DNA-binding NarL/FixJ family response regulator